MTERVDHLDQLLKVVATALALTIVLAAIVVPIAWLWMNTIQVKGAFSLEAYRAAFANRDVGALFLNTLGVALLATVMACAIALPLAILLGRSDLPLRKTLTALLLIPFVLPPYVTALTWVFLIGNGGMLAEPLRQLLGLEENPFFVYGRVGAGLLLGLVLFPLALLLLIAALQRVERSAEEAAALAMRPWAVIRHIVFPAILPTLLLAALLIFIIALTTFDVPAFLQVDVYAVQILTEFNYSYDAARATALALPLVATALAGVLVLRSFLGRTQLTTQAGTNHTALLGFGRRSRLVVLGPILVAGVVTVLPFAALAACIDSINTLDAMLSTAGDEFLLSLQVAALAALLMTLAGLLLASWSLNAPRPLRPWIDVLYLLPLALPPSLLGVALINVYNRPGWLQDHVYATPWILVIADIGRFLPFVALILRSSLRRIPQRSLEAARCHGLGFIPTMWHIYLPHLRVACLNALLIGFLFSLGELAASQLVAPPGYATAPIRMFTILHYGEDGIVAGIALLLMVFALLLFALYQALANRRPDVL